jgi:hypothetical protein
MSGAQRPALLAHEDWWAIWMGGLLAAVAVAGLVGAVPAVGRWTASPFEALGAGRAVSLAALGLGLTALTGLAAAVMGTPVRRHARGFAALFLLAVASYLLAQQTGLRAAGVGYAFWALGLGLLIANTAGPPRATCRHMSITRWRSRRWRSDSMDSGSGITSPCV